MLFALLLQAVSVVLLRHRLGKTWLRRPAVILVLASVVYQGVSTALLAIPSIGAQDYFRTGIAQAYVDQATLLLSCGMLAFTVAYLLARPERSVPAAIRPGDSAGIPGWPLLAAACVPLAVFTFEGRGYNSNVVSAGSLTPLSVNLASAFFLVLVVLAAYGFLARHGTRWFLPVLAAQSGVLAAAGERTPVVADAIALIVLLSVAGHRPRARQIAAALALTLAAMVAITGLRAQQGRAIFYRDSGASARFHALAGGISALGSSQPGGGAGLLASTAVRLDGVDYTAGILQAVHLGQPRLSPALVPGSLLLAVPSSLWQSKQQYVNGIFVYQVQIDDFGLQPVNLLPGFAGLYAGLLSPLWLIAFLALTGILAGYGERLLFRSVSPARIVLLAGAVIAVLDYERGLPGMLVAFRAAVVIAVLVRLASAVRRRHSRAALPAGISLISPGSR